MIQNPTNSLEDMSFIITGGSQGIGAGTARVAASRGARIVVADINDVDGAAVVSEIVENGGTAEYFHCDITDHSQIHELMQFTAQTHGGIDVLHNNAGMHENSFTQEKSIETLSVELFDKIFAINVRGMFLCSREALPYLKESSYPSIINAGSISTFIGFPENLAYGPSKAAVAGITRNLAVDLARYRIRVNCYCPGTIRTRMVTDYAQGSPDPDATMKELANWHLIPRLGEPVDIASLVCIMANREASFITGAVWLIDGGALSWRASAEMLGLAPESAG